MTVTLSARKRILIAGNFFNFSTTLGLAEGFEKLGWEVIKVNLGDYQVLGRSILKKIKNRICIKLNIARYNNEIWLKIEKCNPEFFLVVKGSYIYGSTIEKASSAGIYCVNYYPDAHFSHHGVDENNFKKFNLFITTKSYQLNYLKNKLYASDVRFLHHGYLPQFHTPPDQKLNLNYKTDILYVGNYAHEKEQWLTSLKKKIPEFNLKIYGNGWSSAKNNDVINSSIVGSPVMGQDYAEAVYNAKVNLAIHMGITDKTGWADLVSTRTFEIPACKGFMLHVDNDELRELFTPGEEIDVFNDIDELCEKVKYYLDNETVRKEMVERAYQRCVPAYSYDERARTIAAWIMSAQ